MHSERYNNHGAGYVGAIVFGIFMLFFKGCWVLSIIMFVGSFIGLMMDKGEDNQIVRVQYDYLNSLLDQQINTFKYKDTPSLFEMNNLLGGLRIINEKNYGIRAAETPFSDEVITIRVMQLYPEPARKFLSDKGIGFDTNKNKFYQVVRTRCAYIDWYWEKRFERYGEPIPKEYYTRHPKH